MFNKINISIDDITPHPNASLDVLDRCYELIGIFPDIKFTLFVPMAYYRTVPIPSHIPMCESPMNIDNYPDFCKTLLDLPDSNFELGYHGLHHGIEKRSNNDEFRYLSYEDSFSKFKKMENIAEKAGIKDKMGLVFRPPAWKMTPEAILAARDFGFRVLALSSESIYSDGYCEEHLKKNDVVYANCYPPFAELKYFPKNEILYHASEWDKNYLNREAVDDLVSFLGSLKDFDFCFIGDLL